MTVIARLSALLTANSTQFESNLKRANSAMGQARQSWNNDLNRAGRNFDGFSTQIKRSIGSITDLKTQLGGIAVSVASALSVGKVIQYADAWKELESRLKIATGSSENLAQVQKELFDVAQNTAAPLRDVIDAYGRMSLSLNDAQKSQYDLIKVTDLLSKTLLISGTSAAGSATFFQQFGQAASSDFKAVGQEIQTFQDQNAFFVKILQENLDTGGRSIKQFAADGDLSFGLIAEALIKAQGRIDEAAGQIPITVGKALQKLDNAFLRFIGQTDAIRAGTSSLALGINLLAENFGTLATAAAAVAAVIGAQFIGAMVRGAAAMAASAFQAYAYQLALARMAGVSATAATATLGLSAATTTLGSALAFLGGPVGVAVIGALSIMALKTYAAGEAQRTMNSRLEEHRAAVLEFITAEESRKQAIIDSTKSNIENLKKELEAVIILYNAYQNKSFAGKFLQNLGAQVGIGQGVKEIANEGAALETALAELERNLAGFEAQKGAPKPTSPSGDTSGKKKKDTFKDILDGLKNESDQLKLQSQLYGQKAEAVDRETEALRIKQQLEKAGVTITAAQQAQIDEYLVKIEEQNTLQAAQEKQYQRLEQAAESFGSAANDVITDSIIKARTFGDVLGYIEDALLQVERALVKAFISDPISDSITNIAKAGLGGGGGGGGGFFSGIGDALGFGSFASGIDYVPQDMYAKLHKGEAVMRSSELNSMRGGGNLSVVIQDYAGNNIKTAKQDGADGRELIITLDKIGAQNLRDPKSEMNKALREATSRTVIRRG